MGFDYSAPRESIQRLNMLLNQHCTVLMCTYCTVLETIAFTTMLLDQHCTVPMCTHCTVLDAFVPTTLTTMRFLAAPVESEWLLNSASLLCLSSAGLFQIFLLRVGFPD